MMTKKENYSDKEVKEVKEDNEGKEKNKSIGCRMEQVMNKEYPPFNGLVAPGDMLRCNGAQLIAENHQSPECVDAARACLSNPFSEECKNKLNYCAMVSPNEPLSKLVMDNCGFAYRA